ncbi:MAG: SusC/RagA family TonB-linked outer membrane protein [Capnocytophaga sp.]|nr:SusC/RagA family TonB-linked outer membrane protein [Capnocytophaga sp.]
MKAKLIGFFLFLLSLGASAQEKVVTGTVTDRDGFGLPGVAIQVKGESVGTQTDFDGNYSIRVAQGKVLIFTYLGMYTEERPVGASNTINLNMREDTEQLDEVIVVAYGTAKKSTYAGAASVVGAQQIENRPLTNVASALEGNTTGVQMTSGLGQPGESPNVRIRGFGSVNASNAPIYVVDGAIYNNAISLINPNDIESVTVLKDAVSTALYGASAGNGVILITTKKGRADKAGVNVNVSTGISHRAYDDYSRVGVRDYYPLQWQMLRNSLVTAGRTQAVASQAASDQLITRLGGYNVFTGIANTEVVGTDGLLNPNASALKWGDDLDWEKAAFSTGYRQEYGISYSSKSEKSDTYASIGYLNDEGYMLNTDFERFNGRINYNIYSLDWFAAGLNLSATKSNSNYSLSTSENSSLYGNMTNFIRYMAPIYPVRRHDLVTGEYLDSDGNVTTNPNEYTYDYLGGRLSSSGRDAIAETLLNNRMLTNTNTSGNAYFKLMPLDGLSFTVNYSHVNNDNGRKVYENPLVGDGAPAARLGIRSIKEVTKTFNQLANYSKTFGKHGLEVLLGHENYDYKYEYLYGMRNQEIIGGIQDFSNFVNISTLSSYTHTYRKESYFSRVSYDYDGRYTLSGSFRRDGSSRFAKDNRWGNFYSIGGAWILSNEDFLKNSSWINYLKLRASWGQTGNDMVIDSDNDPVYYPYQTLYTLGINNGSESGAYFSNLSNPALKWETQVSSDVALEFTLFRNLSGTVEYFQKESEDLLFDVSIASSNGVNNITQNIGKLQNRGIELELDYKIINTPDWRVSLGANATFVKNKIVSLPESNRANGIINGSKKLMEGHSIYEFWLRQWWGVNPANGDGLFVLDTDAFDAAYAIANATQRTAMDRTVVEIDGQRLTNTQNYAKFDFSGSAIPKVYGGFNFKVGYKAFELSGIFTYSLGGKLLDANYRSLMATNAYGSAMHTDLLRAWQQQGDVTDVPRIDATAAYNTNIGQANSTRWLTSSDFLNFRTATLSCNIPKEMIEALQLSSATVNLSAENIFLLTKRQGLNPQGNYTGVTYNGYIPARTISFGVNLSF